MFLKHPGHYGGPRKAHLQQTDVIGVGGGLVVRVPDDSRDAEHLLCGLRAVQDVSPQHHQARPGVPAGGGGIEGETGVSACPTIVITFISVSTSVTAFTQIVAILSLIDMRTRCLGRMPPDCIVAVLASAKRLPRVLSVLMAVVIQQETQSRHRAVAPAVVTPSLLTLTFLAEPPLAAWSWGPGARAAAAGAGGPGVAHLWLKQWAAETTQRARSRKPPQWCWPAKVTDTM